MVTREDLESFLIRMDMDWNEVDEGMFLVQSPSGGVVVHFSDPVLLVRLKVMDLPNSDSDLAELYRALLELNATDIVHGAYGIEDGELILTDTLELQNLDFEELQASVESLQFAAASHLGRIKVLAGRTTAVRKERTEANEHFFKAFYGHQVEYQRSHLPGQKTGEDVEPDHSGHAGPACEGQAGSGGGHRG